MKSVCIRQVSLSIDSLSDTLAHAYFVRSNGEYTDAEIEQWIDECNAFIRKSFADVRGNRGNVPMPYADLRLLTASTLRRALEIVEQ